MSQVFRLEYELELEPIWSATQRFGGGGDPLSLLGGEGVGS